MKIIISPAKKMINSSDDFLPESTPVFLSKTQQLLEELKTYSRQDLKQVLKCNDQLLALNEERFQTMNLSKNCSCALMSYVGLQYQHMGSHLFSMEEDSKDSEAVKLPSSVLHLPMCIIQEDSP